MPEDHADATLALIIASSFLIGNGGQPICSRQWPWTRTCCPFIADVSEVPGPLSYAEWPSHRAINNDLETGLP